MPAPPAVPPQFARGGRAGRGESPGLKHAIVGVAFDGEQDVSAADVFVSLEWRAGVPAVARELMVGGIEELVRWLFVLADEEHEWRLVESATAVWRHHQPRKLS